MKTSLTNLIPENRTTATPGPERRILTAAGLRLERRAGDDDPKMPKMPMIMGHAAVFDQWTTLYESKYYAWREVVRPGAYRNALSEGQDIRALFNHKADWVLGRTKSGTCRLKEDARGLACEIDPPDTQLVRDLVLTPIERGDVSGMSIAFTIRPGGERVTIREEDDRVIEEREVLDADLFDVSPVTYPAFEQTDVSLRCRAEARAVELHDRFLKTPWRNRAARLLRLALAD